MRITDIQVDVVRDPEFEVRMDTSLETVVVQVHTDEGIIGIGDAASSPRVVRAVLEAPSYFTLSRAVPELLIGRDPLEIGALWEEVYRLTMYSGRRGAYIHALSALDLALWDILGKATGLPVYKLLGGAFQRQVRAYASHVMPSTPAKVRDLAARAVDLGWPALKMGWFPHDTDPASDLAMVRAAREGAGAAHLMLDVGPRWNITADGCPAVQLWDAKTATRAIRSWADYEPYWIEEPLPPDDVNGYGKLTAAVDTYIAAGEEETIRFGIYDLMDRGGIDVVQFDVSHVGGLTEARRITQAAHDRNRPIAPHCFSTGINFAASLHLMAATPNAFYLEYPMSGTTVLTKLVQPHFEHEGGTIRVPEDPGLGVELDRDLLAALRVA